MQEATTFHSKEMWQIFRKRSEISFDINYSHSVTASVWLMY